MSFQEFKLMPEMVCKSFHSGHRIVITDFVFVVIDLLYWTPHSTHLVPEKMQKVFQLQQQNGHKNKAIQNKAVCLNHSLCCTSHCYYRAAPKNDTVCTQL